MRWWEEWVVLCVKCTQALSRSCFCFCPAVPVSDNKLLLMASCYCLAIPIRSLDEVFLSKIGATQSPHLNLVDESSAFENIFRVTATDCGVGLPHLCCTGYTAWNPRVLDQTVTIFALLCFASLLLCRLCPYIFPFSFAIYCFMGCNAMRQFSLCLHKKGIKNKRKSLCNAICDIPWCPFNRVL